MGNVCCHFEVLEELPLSSDVGCCIQSLRRTGSLTDCTFACRHEIEMKLGTRQTYPRPSSSLSWVVQV